MYDGKKDQVITSYNEWLSTINKLQKLENTVEDLIDLEEYNKGKLEELLEEMENIRYKVAQWI